MKLVFLTEETGQLLHEGCIGGQPNWFIEAIEIFRVERAKAAFAKKTDKR